MRLKSLFFITTFSTSMNLWAQMCTPPSADPNMKSYEDILYKGDLGMDLYLPAEGENFPLAFIVHGGS